MALSDNPGLVVSSVSHAALLLAALVGFSHTPKFSDAEETVPVEMVSDQQFNQIMKGEKTACHYEAIQADLREPATRHALFTQLGTAAKRSLVITEGLLIYLTPEQVAALASDLHAVRTFQWWLFDIASPQLLGIMNKYWAKNVQSAPFLFAPADGTMFFERFGWTEREFRSTMEEGHRLKREMPMMWLWRILGALNSKKRREEMKRISGAVLTERT